MEQVYADDTNPLGTACVLEEKADWGRSVRGCGCGKVSTTPH